MPDAEQTSLERDTAEIVAAYVSHHQLTADQLGSLIRNVHTALSNLGKPAEEPVERIPAVPIRRSVQRDYVVCLECGWRGKVLRRHIGNSHELSPDEYRQRWNLSREHLLTAPAYAEARSGLAKRLGLGRRRQDDAGESARPEAQAQAEKPAGRRRGRRRSAASGE
jgi:predicted transcriptional regulator